MADNDIDGLKARLLALLAKASPLPWDRDEERGEGEYGSGPDTHAGFDVQVIYAEVRGKLVTLFDSHNSSATEIEEEFDDEAHSAWDAVALANAKLVVEAVNALPALLTATDALASDLRQAAARILALTDAVGKMRDALEGCRELFSEIRADWSDPRSECRLGREVIDAALKLSEGVLK